MYGMHCSGTIVLAVLHSGCGLEVRPGYGSQPGDGCSLCDCYQAIQVFLILLGGAEAVWGPCDTVGHLSTGTSRDWIWLSLWELESLTVIPQDRSFTLKSMKVIDDVMIEISWYMKREVEGVFTFLLRNCSVLSELTCDPHHTLSLSLRHIPDGVHFSNEAVIRL